MSKPVKQSQLFETVSHVIGIGTKAPAARVTKKEPVASTLHEKNCVFFSLKIIRSIKGLRSIDFACLNSMWTWLRMGLRR